MKSLKIFINEASLLADIDDTINASNDFGKDVSKIVDLLKDPLSAHYSSYSPNDFIKGVKRAENTIYVITPEDQQKWCGKYKTPTQLWEDKGQPGWEAVYKLAKKDLKLVTSKAATHKTNPCGDFIIFSKPSKRNEYWPAKVITITVVRKNAEINKSKHTIEIRINCDKTLTYVGYEINTNHYFSDPSSYWDYEIFDLNSNLGWCGLIEEIFDKMPSIGNQSPDKNEVLKKYPLKIAPIK